MMDSLSCDRQIVTRIQTGAMKKRDQPRDFDRQTGFAKNIQRVGRGPTEARDHVLNHGYC